MLYNKLTLLSWNNYLEITDLIDNGNYKQDFWSPISMVSWMFYDFKFYFHVLEDNHAIIFYIYDPKYASFKICTSFYQDNFCYDDYKNIILQDLSTLNNDTTLVQFDQISESMIQDWDLKNFEFEPINYVSNYIYYLEGLKTFAGKQLQKKRNHLNYFLKHNNNYTIKLINDVDPYQIIEYTKEHTLQYQQFNNQNEIDIYIQFLLHEINKSSNFKGIVIYMNNKIVAVTICYLRKDICEIILEKASQEIRGLYQFLISENLKINNINQLYMDRQDDVSNEALAKSKMSYHPIKIIKRFRSL